MLSLGSFKCITEYIVFTLYTLFSISLCSLSLIVLKMFLLPPPPPKTISSCTLYMYVYVHCVFICSNIVTSVSTPTQLASQQPIVLSYSVIGHPGRSAASAAGGQHSGSSLTPSDLYHSCHLAGGSGASAPAGSETDLPTSHQATELLTFTLEHTHTHHIDV